MMSEWTETTLAELVEIKHGFAFKGEFFQTEPNSNILITPGNFHIGGGFKGDKFKYYNGEIPEDYILHGGEVIVTMTDLSKEVDTLGYSAIVPTDDRYTFLHNQRIGLVIPKHDQVCLPFIYWLMRSPEYRWHVISSASGSTVSHTSPTRIQEFTFDIPPYEEQEAIAAVLSSLDDKIDLLRRQNGTLESLAQALFRYWFVDGADDDWEEVQLGDFFPVITGKKDANFSTEDGEYPFFTCAQTTLQAPSYSYEGKAILLAGNGDFNVKRYDGKFEAYQRTYVLMPYQSEYFGYLYTLVRYYLNDITGHARGSVIQYITKGMITDFRIMQIFFCKKRAPSA